MPETQLKVQVISYTCSIEEIINIAGHLCYSNKSIDELVDKYYYGSNLDDLSILIRKIIDMGHLSLLENVSFTFGIEGVSRSLLSQLARHRIGISMAVRSQRYVNEKNFNYIIPGDIKKNHDYSTLTKQLFDKIQDLYDEMVENNVPVESARYILPNACETKLVMTINARELLHIFSLRLCNRAQEEFRNLAFEILRLVKEVSPVLFEKAAPNCVYDKCKEGKLSCGKMIEVKEKFKNME